MAHKQNRQESLPDKDGLTFKINDGVHYGFNGDCYPGTVRRISDSGRQLWISKDDHKATQAEKDFVNEFGIHDGPINSVFIPLDLHETEWQEFKLRKDGAFRSVSCNWKLNSGRVFSQNPSF